MKNWFARVKKHLKSPFVWIALLYLLSAKGHMEVIDTEYSVRTAKAMIEHGSMRIEPVDKDFLAISVNPSVDGKIYSQYGLGLPILFIPFITLGKILASIFGQPEERLVYFALSFYNIPFALLGLWFLKGILLKLGRDIPQANATLVLLAVGTAYWPYAVTDFSEVTQVAFLLGALHAILSHSEKKWLSFSLWFALLTSIKLAYLIFLPLFLAYALYENWGDYKRQAKTVMHSAVFLFPLGLVLAYANHARFGSILESGYGSNPGIGFGIQYFLRTAFPSILSLKYGLLLFNPILFTFPLWAKVLQASKRFALLCIALMVTWFCLMCSYSYGWGWAWGQRYVFLLIPISMICVSFAGLGKTNLLRVSPFSIMAVSSCFIQLVAVSTKFHEPLTMQIKAEKQFEGPYSPQLPSTILLFSHKLFDGSTNNPLSIIGGDENESVDLNDYESFRGFNFWPVHALKFFGLDEYERMVGLSLLSIIVIIQFGLLKIHLPKLLSKRHSE